VPRITQTPNEVMAAFSHKELAKIFIDTRNENEILIKIIKKLELKLTKKKERKPC